MVIDTYILHLLNISPLYLVRDMKAAIIAEKVNIH